MNGHVFLWFLFVVVLLGVGCDEPQEQRQAAYSDIQGITLADLQAEQHSETESLLSFSVLTYVLDADSLESLETIIGSLSQRDIHYDKADAFEANGFSAGCGAHQEGASIAQKLQSIGAVRVTQSSLIIPANSNEILYESDVTGPNAIIYSTSATGAGGATIGTGKLGWIISAQKDPVARGVVSVTLSPAFWEIGASDLRLLAGKEPYQYHFFDVGRVHFDMEAGRFCLLGPHRVVRDEDTLDRILFEVPRRNMVRFFVIIFGGQREIDGA
ncbi:MAG: hypothetical protein ISS71_06800 [Phycisphaerae bacterium]|nr:hypothetical protein [Phycisphaerae bacterium]